MKYCLPLVIKVFPVTNRDVQLTNSEIWDGRRESIMLNYMKSCEIQIIMNKTLCG